MNEITILHLSDIHFKKKKDEKNKTFRQKVQERLMEAVTGHSKKEGNPDFVVITGDIAFSGKKEEYDEAREFLGQLKKELPKGTEFLAVPGNHDVDRDTIDEFFPLQENIIAKDLTDKFLENEQKVKGCINVKFKAYREFIDRLHPGLYRDKEDYSWVKNYKEKNVSFLGLNSAWACEGDQDPLHIALGFPQAVGALDKSKDMANKIVLFHHPLSNCFELKDFNKWSGEIFAACRLILHGHVHFDNALGLNTPSASCISIGANAVYTHDTNGGYIGFQFIRVCFEKERTIVRVWPYKLETREQMNFLSDTSRWKGQKGKAYYDIETYAAGREKDQISLAPLQIPAGYRDWVLRFHSKMDTGQLDPNGKAHHVSLPEVYIPIETANPFYKPKEGRLKGEMEDEAEGAEKDAEPEEPPFIDIEKLLGRKNCVLLQGPAGMGKTTLIKHLAYTITSGIGEVSLSGYLPVVVLLKDLWPLYDLYDKEPGKAMDFPTILAVYLEKYFPGLSLKEVEQYCSRDRALFLIDGLDEVPAHLRGNIVEMISMFRLKHENNRFLLTGRPHGVDARVREHFGVDLHRIEPLDEAKVKVFIKKWFSIVSGQAAGLAEAMTGEMIADVRSNEYVVVFTENPLLLTAVCILYQDNKRLPDQRADLYNRVVANLLYRRFHHLPPEQSAGIEQYLKLLAFRMQERNLKKIDVGEAREMLKEVFPAGKLPRSCNGDIHAFFEEIEPRCGLLKRSGEGEIEFFHLTFQEFLAARHMQYAEIDYKQYLEKPWWEETILLYTGLFDREYKDKANRLATEILTYPHKDERCLRRLWLLGSKSLRDLQGYKRDGDILNMARTKLLAIIESQTSTSLEERFEAGEILGQLGDPRIDALNPPMVLVKAGEFTRGSEEHDREKPVRQIYLDEFMMGKYPVTNQEFRAFIHANGYETKDYWTPEGWKWRQKEKISGPRFWHERKWNWSNFPVVGVNWYEAAAYTQWLSRKTGKNYGLPTEAQWEKTSRGSDGFQYPWGNKFDKNKCNSAESGLGRTSPVGIFPLGKSPYGCMDMAGNVWEWCSDWYSKDYYKGSPEKNPEGPSQGIGHVLRGGSWNVLSGNLRCAARSHDHPWFNWYGSGFRVVCAPPSHNGENKNDE
ncbi:MAG: SUMF1/EgtB/PvdO family nonheme iron enzyme [Candidatus Aminicenantes bacterium]|nr:SUMF1/EgtB/PvdO family nonheme iron enzyme [Candidatus Aminicenantes bacterium]